MCYQGVNPVYYVHTYDLQCPSDIHTILNDFQITDDDIDLIVKRTYDAVQDSCIRGSDTLIKVGGNRPVYDTCRVEMD